MLQKGRNQARPLLVGALCPAKSGYQHQQCGVSRLVQGVVQERQCVGEEERPTAPGDNALQRYAHPEELVAFAVFARAGAKEARKNCVLLGLATARSAATTSVAAVSESGKEFIARFAL